MKKLEYKALTNESRQRIKDRLVEPVQENFSTFLPQWEEEHFEHSLLHEELLASGNHPDGPCEHEEAMDVLATGVVNVRAGKKPDAEGLPDPSGPPGDVVTPVAPVNPNPPTPGKNNKP